MKLNFAKILFSKSQAKGSVALMSILIIAAFTLILVIAMSEVNFSTSYQSFNHSANNIANYAAESCLEEALLRLETNEFFLNATLNIDADISCNVTVSGNQISVLVNFLDFAQNYQADLAIVQNGQARNLDLLNWKEIY